MYSLKKLPLERIVSPKKPLEKPVRKVFAAAADSIPPEDPNKGDKFIKKEIPAYLKDKIKQNPHNDSFLNKIVYKLSIK